MKILLLDIIPTEGYPLWLVIILGIGNLLVPFWPKIVSMFEIKILGKTKINEKKIDHELQIQLKKFEQEAKRVEEERRKVNERVAYLETKELENLQTITQLKMAITFMIDKYAKDNPDQDYLVMTVKEILEGVHNPINS